VSSLNRYFGSTVRGFGESNLQLYGHGGGGGV